ncbi:tetratricopeptide repeat protein [Rufibacter quisquiliarum]|uniref:Tetratricopeptide (TPR) repeat protein n=1 Tax=Rufibacter quisquiliarum TaxID=1549639 RepID=A0A839GCR9_9BACT|nr:tetratricopeptide repeat protein [Rufibacter quisquiliarum]MBA9077384.1 tetratricopeptide (TPR) repeat protein [Rufibacter quisquiliarum]
MKKFLLTVTAAVAMQSAFAQTSAITNAIMFQQKGTLDKAKSEIDKAVTNEKTKDNAKAWFYKGVIYQDLAGHPIYGKTVNAAEVSRQAYEAFEKVPALESTAKKKEFTQQAKERQEALQSNLYAFALNEGVEHYNNKKFAEAQKAYLEAVKLKPQDTTAYIYAAYAAAGNEDYASAKKMYNQLVEKNMASPTVYSQLLYIASNVEKNDQETLAVLEKARKAYPENKNFMLQELDLFIKAGKGEESMAKLDAAIKADPTNANLYTVKGNLLERVNKADEALASYKKAAELDPSNFDAQFNMGVYYFNKGANMNNKANKMSYAEFQKSGKALQAEAKKQFSQAVPYFENALKLQPKDRNTVQSLLKAYTALDRQADAKRMDTLLQTL